MDEHPFGWFSLLPPVVAIVLAIATRRIVLSLVAGIFGGALLMAGGNPLVAIYHTWETHLWNTLIDPGKLRVFSFTIVMGAMIGLITKAGGMQGLINLIGPYASDRRRGQLGTWIMGMLIFFDDYANTILLGSTLRPVTDRLKISRQKLAYLVDSTAAPVAGLAPLSTWVAIEIDYIADGLSSVDASGTSAFALFLASIPYRFYIWSALFLVPIIALLGRDFGPMLKAERDALLDETVPQESESAAEPTKARWYNAVLPILFTLAVVIYFIVDTGSRGACISAADLATEQAQAFGTPDEMTNELITKLSDVAATGRITQTKTQIASLANAMGDQMEKQPDLPSGGITSPALLARDILGEADSSLALQYGALAGLALAVVLVLFSRAISVDQIVGGAMSGAKVVLPAVAILWTASAMSRMTTADSVDGAESAAYEFKDHRLYTADFLTSIISGEGDDTASVSQSAKYFPTIVFLLAAVVAFCTGTSWGTMGILVPMVVQSGYALLSVGEATVSPNDPILLSAIGGVLAGAVFGDHCSPISDTTVLSSQSSGCDHLSHVWTQMPYALLAAAISVLLGTLPIAFGYSVWLCLPLQLAALVLVVRLIGRKAVTA